MYTFLITDTANATDSCDNTCCANITLNITLVRQCIRLDYLLVIGRSHQIYSIQLMSHTIPLMVIYQYQNA